MQTLRRLIFPGLSMISAVLLLASCGGGGGGGASGTVTPAGTGSVGIVLTDKPAELSEIDEILISITGVDLLGADDGNRTTLYSGPARGPFDLFELEDESRLLTFEDDVPTGTYCKIRLTLSDLTLVFEDGDTFHPKLPGNNKLDLEARECFQVAPGRSVYLQLDMDARSIHVVQTGNGKRYNFRPVVFIDVMDADFDAKLVRLESGVIRDIDSENGTLLLCDFDFGDGYDERSTDDGSDDCVNIAVRDAAAFDNIDSDGINTTSDGDAIPLDELLVPERIGTRPVTVIGRMRNHPESEHNDEDDNEDEDSRHHYPRLEALVVELGSFLSLDGNVSSGASDIRFNMDVAPDQAVSPDDALTVALQATVPPVNGTRIMTPEGDPLKTSDIIVPRPVLVDGVLAVSGTGPDYLNSALVIVGDTDSDATADVAHGIVAETSAGGLRLEADSFPCESVPDAIYDVEYIPTTTVYVATSSEGFWRDTGYLQPRQEVDISGTCTGTTLAADVIIVREN